MSSLPRKSVVVAILVVGLIVSAAIGEWSSRTSAAAPGEARPVTAPETLNLVPWPKSVQVETGRCALTTATRIVAADPRLIPLAEILTLEIRDLTGLSLGLVQEAARAGDIVLALKEQGQNVPPDSYSLVVDERAVVTGTSYYAVSLGTVTLLQALRSEHGTSWLPRLEVTDGPHFAYLGTMLDLARKPYSLETLRQCIRVCRFYKIRYVLLHMSDENAWTFPSTAYPQLGSQNFAWAGGEKPTPYRLQELQDLVAFADARGVTLVPEMEIPGHSGQLRGTLLEIFGYRDAAGKSVGLGVINMVSEPAFRTLDTLIGEMRDVFRSSPFFHIGCDEASLGGVAEMPEVQEFAARHKLTDPHAVFNLFVKRMHGIVKSHGKRMIVWEGAPTGPEPLPKDIVFMPWIGGSGVAAALVKEGFSVINAPWGVEQPYFDPYRVNGAQLPRGEPRLLGSTSLLWESESDRAVPFLRFTAALRNEPAYNPNSGRNYEDFLSRLRVTDQRLDRLLYGIGIGPTGTAPAAAQTALVPVFEESFALTLETGLAAHQIRYTLDGSEPVADSPLYNSPIPLGKTTTLKARLSAADGVPVRPTLVREFRRLTPVPHDGVGAQVTIQPDQPGYAGPGPRGLSDGFLALGYDLERPGWVGWVNDGQPVTITLDFGKLKEIQRVSTHCLRSNGGVAIPQRVEFLVSTDGELYRSLVQVDGSAAFKNRGWFEAQVALTTARYLRVVFTPGGDWTFVDEVTVNAAPRGTDLRHAALGKPVTLAVEPNAYTAPGIAGLTDGSLSLEPNFLSLEWLGFESRPIQATLDLGEVRNVQTVGANFLQDVRAGIFIPQTVEVSVSTDGVQFREVAKITRPADQLPKYLATLATQLHNIPARYIRLNVPSRGTWLFIDEIFVDPQD